MSPANRACSRVAEALRPEAWMQSAVPDPQNRSTELLASKACSRR